MYLENNIKKVEINIRSQILRACQAEPFLASSIDFDTRNVEKRKKIVQEHMVVVEPEKLPDLENFSNNTTVIFTLM